MRDTGSIRTATRWRSSSRGLRRASAALAVLVLGACVTTTSTSYLPDASRDRLSLADAQDALDQLVAVECTRLLAAKQDIGEGEITVDVDPSGNVTRSTFSRGHAFGDERMEKIFGGVTAQMKFDAPPAGRDTGRMRVGYACTSTASTATLQLL